MVQRIEPWLYIVSSLAAMVMAIQASLTGDDIWVTWLTLAVVCTIGVNLSHLSRKFNADMDPDARAKRVTEMMEIVKRIDASCESSFLRSCR